MRTRQTLTKARRIYLKHLEQKAKGEAKGKDMTNNAAIARMFHCSREYVRQVIEIAEIEQNASLARAQQYALENQNSVDTLVER